MRPVFVGGCPRSGTTLLGALLGAHSRCLCVPEMQFNVNHLLDLDWDGERMTWRRLGDLLEEKWDFRLWGIPGDALYGAPEGEPPEADRIPGYREAIESVVRRYAGETGAASPDVWIDHTPGNLRQGGELLARFPDAHLVHLVRDGRAVAASMVPLSWGPHTVVGAARSWSEWLSFGLAREAVRDDRVHRVHYEELVRRPTDVLGELCGRLGLDPEEGLGTRTEFRLPSYSRRQHSLVPRPPDPTRADAWRDDLADRQVEIFESLAGDLLSALGYSLVHGGRARRPTAGERRRLRLRAMLLTPLRRVRRWLRRRRHARDPG